MPHGRTLGSIVAGAVQASARTAEDGDLPELLARSRCDDQPARDKLVVALYPHLRRFVAHHFPAADLDQRQDFVHDAVLRVISHLDACRARSWSGFRAWAFATARRVALSHYRLTASAALIDWDAVHELAEHSRGHDRDSVADLLRSGRSGDIIATDVGRDVASSLACEAGRGAEDDAGLGVIGDDALEGLGTRLARLAAAAQTVLPSGTQELIYLRVVEHRSWSEIADMLEIPASAAKRRFQRAQGRLRDELMQRVGTAPEPFRTEAVVWLSVRCRRRLAALPGTPALSARTPALRPPGTGTACGGPIHGASKAAGRIAAVAR